MATQETEASIVNNIPLSKKTFKDIKELSEYVDTYNYDVSPEMVFFYQNEFVTKYPNITYNEIKFSGDQFLRIFDSSNITYYLNNLLNLIKDLNAANKTETNLYISSNMLDFYFYYTSVDIYSLYRKFNIKSEYQLYFIADYLKYLTKNFFDINIKVGNTTIATSNDEVAFASLSPQTIINSIKSLSDNEKIRIVVTAKLLFERLSLNKISCLTYLVPLLNGKC